MKKNNIKWIFNNHSTERFFERTALNVTKKQIAKAITNNQIVYFKRVNATRSMAYIHVNSEVIKTVMHRKKDKIITILPWKSIYQYTVEIKIKKFNNKIYRMNLFPDCYLETNRPNALTKMFQYHGKDIYYNQKGYKKIQFDHPQYNEIFRIAWDYFEADCDHQLIQKERSKGNETFEIKGKAKKIETLIYYDTYEEDPNSGIYSTEGERTWDRSYVGTVS